MPPTAPPGTAPPTATPSAAAPGAPRQTAWQEGVERLRAAAVTEPGRLRVIGAVLAALVLGFGAVTAWQVSDRAAAADAVVERSQPLSADAADIYRSLADADTTAASGFLAGGDESSKVRRRYVEDIATASKRLAEAAGTGGSPAAQRQIARLNERLPVYTGIVEAARANNRQGLPLGGAYLRYANELMTTELLPAARALYETESARLDRDYADAEAWPWAALGAGVLALGGLGWAQRRLYQRTNRVLNHGLLAATASTTVVLLWLAVGHGVASARLDDSDEHGARSLRVLNEARITALQARGDENLTLVARGAVVVTKEGPDQGKDAYEVGYRDQMRALVGSESSVGLAERGSLLSRASELADDRAGREPVARALDAVRQWQERHRSARATDDNGEYDSAVAQVIGAGASTRESFDRIDAALAEALAHEDGEFRDAADDGRGALSGLVVGAAVLAVLGAAGAVLGIGRRLSEYR
ncbi:hypothetical protein LRS74_22745 [Streptomyces sp. LX-29]|uniref:hypothetical protein n=1 Tax=Streptomyces sp. LX-29 TaxID=2900152 RepID=UPI00240DADAA|nr:hypothetical protein [Streptomyces sp. LX-29]WFB11785.1 hypothetical protein LRS74_22745 [Streptomyces sp. LX-29]